MIAGSGSVITAVRRALTTTASQGVPIQNPYDPPAKPGLAERNPNATPLSLRHHAIRNLVSWGLCLTYYCVMDYFYVRYGAASVSFAEFLFAPIFIGAVLFANRGLFPDFEDGVSRWCAIAGVSFLLACVSGYILITLGIWFHLAIGGSL